jgi:hypothetical protein
MARGQLIFFFSSKQRRGDVKQSEMEREITILLAFNLKFNPLNRKRFKVAARCTATTALTYQCVSKVPSSQEAAAAAATDAE